MEKLKEVKYKEDGRGILQTVCQCHPGKKRIMVGSVDCIYHCKQFVSRNAKQKTVSCSCEE